MTESKTAMITGIGGQDGSYLTEFLLKKGYKVRGIIRRGSYPNTKRIDHLIEKYESFDNKGELSITYSDLTDASSIRNAIEMFKPDEIYNLAAQSHVGISFTNGISTFDINARGVFRILDTIRNKGINCKYYQASSSEMFGISPPPQNESTPMLPQSPYGIAKLAGYHITKMHRNAYGMFASNGILFNHESPRRGVNFVTRKITRIFTEVILGKTDRIVLGNLDAKRDWGFSGDYVEAMWRILQHNEPDDFVISTGETYTIRDFLKEVCRNVDINLEWKGTGVDEIGYDTNTGKTLVSINPYYFRPAEVPALLGDSTKAREILKWKPKVMFKDLVNMMLKHDLEERGNEIRGRPVSLEEAKELASKLRN